ncbi:MAG: mechanosensitive ion channel family protein [Saprospiraceae bacterium]|nr:mechanosensitive ion channel family protein [Saprospiraceae bacterium]
MKEQLLDSLNYILVFCGIVVATLVLAYFVNRFFKRLIEKGSEELKNDPTNYKFLRHAIITLIYVVGFSIAIYVMPSLRALASSLLAGAGILAVAIGLASQKALGNVISGFFIVLYKPFRVNDRVTIRGLSGVIEDISLRHTVIRDYHNKRIIIPNTLINDEIIVNADFVDESICKWIEIGVGYNSDLEKAKKIIHEEIIKHPLHIDNRTPQEVMKGAELAPVKVIRLDDSAVILRGWAWAKDSPDGFSLSCEVIESIKDRFQKEGVEIPYPHMVQINI